MNKKVICIMGESGSGKSTIYNYLMYKFEDKYNLKRLIYNTTRPKRSNEIADVDYHFVNGDVFYNEYMDNIIEYRMYQTTNNGTIIYFTHISNFELNDPDSILVCAASPEQIRKYIEVSNKLHIDIFTIKIETILKDRLTHLINRCKDDSDIYESIRRVHDEKTEFDANADIIMAESKYSKKIFNNYDGNISEFEEFIKTVKAY